MTYGVAFLGTGYMAGKHAAALREDPRARLVAAAGSSPDSPRAREFVHTHGFERVGTGIDELLADDDVEVVFVCSPDATHADYVDASLSAGKHVLCEKPLALTDDDFARIQRRVADTGKVLQVGMNCRFRSQYVNVKQRADGEFGALRFLRGTYVINSIEPLKTRQKPWQLEFPDGYLPFLYGGGLHCLDLMRWIGGPISSAFARGRGFELADEWELDTFSASLQFENGAIGEFTASASAFRPPDFGLEAWLERGSIVAGRGYRRAGDGVDPSFEELAVAQPRIDVALQFDDMLEAIETGRAPLNSAAEAHDNFRVLAAIDRSLRQGGPVAVQSVGATSQDLNGDPNGNS